MELKTILRQRRSVRAYTKEQITDAQLKAILEAAVLAPVGMGRTDHIQLRVVQDYEILDALNADFISSVGNKDAYPTYGAPTVVFVLGREDMPEVLLGADAACVVENMHLAAVDEGLGSVYLLGICSALKDSAQARALLKVPAGFRLASALAVGYPAAPVEPREPDMDRFKTVYIG